MMALLYKKKANDQYIYINNRIKMMFVYNQLATAHTRTVNYTPFAMVMNIL